MKAAVRLLVRFLLWFGLLLLVVSTFIVAYEYASGYDSRLDAAEFPLLAIYINAVIGLFLPTATFAALIALFDIVREGETVALPLTLLFAVWSIVLAAGVFLLSADVEEPVAVSPALPVERVVRGSGLSLYAAQRVGNTYRSIVIHEPGRFRWADEARLQSPGQILSIPELDRRISLDELSNSYPSMVRIPAPLRRIAADIDVLNQFFRGDALRGSTLDAVGQRAEGRILWFNLAGLSIFLLGLWTLVRLTRWPLFNIVLVVAAWRFALWIIPAVMVGSVRTFVVAASSSAALATVSAGLLAGLGLLLFAAGVLLPPATEQKGASK